MTRVIALEYHGAEGGSPATADASGPYQSRSWIGMLHQDGIDSPSGTDQIFADGFDGTTGLVGPDLAQEDLTLNNVIPGFAQNWIVRGNGVKQNGQPVNVGPAAK